MAKILLVDDALFALNVLAKMIGNEGYQIVRATDGEEGLAEIEAGIPDIIISDLLMPNIDGLSFLRAIRKDHPKLPVIILSANIQTSVRQKCLDAGASVFMHKPPNPEELRAAIEGLL